LEPKPARISVVSSGDKLLAAWEEIGYSPPAPPDKVAEARQAWSDAVETSDHDILIARIGTMAVAFVDIKWTGPIKGEPKFTDALAAAFPGQTPMPTVYSLNVHPYYRRLHIGSGLMDEAEKLVAANTAVVAKIALNVRVNNEAAVPLYLNRGYQTLQYEGDEEIDLDYPDLNEKGEWVKGTDKVYVMVKDLSEARKGLLNEQ